MQINGAEQRGHILLIAGDRAIHRRTVQVHPSANLSALSVVPTAVLLNSTLPADLVHLDGVSDQNTLLLRLRTAAATPGPLLVYLSGRLTLDRKGHRFHLATASTSPANTRYTALPWEWVHNELRTRPAGWTTLLLDLVADKGAWAKLKELGTLPAVNADTYGIVSPPGFPGTEGASPYTRHLIEQLRHHPDRPSAARLHALTVAAAGIPPGTLVLPATPEIEPSYDDEEEPAARPPMTNVQRLLSGDTSFLPSRRRKDEPTQPAPGLENVPTAPAAQFSHAAPAQPQPYQYPSPSPVQPPAAGQAPPAQQPQPSHEQHQERPQTPVRAPHPGTAPVTPQAPAPAPAPRPAPVQQLVQAPPQPSTPYVPPQPTALQQDPRPTIWQSAQAGRHNEAAEMAAAWEQQSLQQYGPDSPQATQWAEIRADLARIAGRWTFATQLWVAATRTRMAHQAPDSAEVLNGAQSAHYCWTQIKDPAEARSCGPELINLLRQLPALDRRHLSGAQQRLEYLQNAPSGPRR